MFPNTLPGVIALMRAYDGSQWQSEDRIFWNNRDRRRKVLLELICEKELKHINDDQLRMFEQEYCALHRYGGPQTYWDRLYLHHSRLLGC